MTSPSMTTRCTTCGHGPGEHEALFPQCAAPRCTCLKYRQSTPSPAPAAATATVSPLRSTTPPAPSVDELIRACARSEYKRTQNLGVKLAAIAEKARAALRAERESAEVKAARSKEIAAAQAEVKRLEKALAEAKAKAVAAGAPGGARVGTYLCPECEHTLSSAQALGAHRAHKHGYRRKASA